MVEYIGMKNLINSLKRSVGLRDGKLLFGFEGMIYYQCTLGHVDVAFVD